MKYALLFGLFFTACTTSYPPTKKEPQPVVVADVIQKDVPLYIDTIGNVHSYQIVQIRPQVTGIIEKAYVKEGQTIKVGDPLYQIDPRPYQAALQKAKAALIKDEATLKFNQEKVERYKDVVQKDFLSVLEYHQFVSLVETTQGQIISDKADIALAELNLEWTTPKSPIDGKISLFNIDPGNLVLANDPNAIANIRTIHPANIRFYLSQKEFFSVQVLPENPTQFEVFLPQDPTNPRKGKITFIDNHINPNNGTILFEGLVPNEDEIFWPGEYVKVRLLLREIPNAILVPEEAIKIGQNGPYVFVYNSKDSTVDLRPIIKGNQIDQMVIIEKGLSFGEKVVTKGQINLHPRDSVYLIGGL